MTAPEWDDDRLEAAFRTKFDRPAPAGLEKDVHVRIVGTSPARFVVVRGRATAWGLAAAAIVVIVVGAVAIGASGLGRGVASQPSDAGVPAPAAIPTPTEQALPGVIFGLPIITVTDAFAIQREVNDDHEIAIHGWFSDGGPISCPSPNVAPINPLQPGCEDMFVWLMERAETLISHPGNQTDMTGPSGPALNPDLDGIDRSWQPTAAEALDANGLSIPTDVVFVGHFDDRRAALCPKAEVADCRDRFVVDSVARVHGTQPPLSVMGTTPGSTNSSVADIEAIVSNEAPQSPILSMTVVDGPAGLVEVEPSLGTDGSGLLAQPLVWIVRVLESERVTTYLVVDGSTSIYEMNPEGQAIQVGGTSSTGQATASPGPWPPADARVIPLTSQVGAGAPPVRVAVVDKSGRLSKVAEKGDVDAATFSFDGRFGAYAEPGHPGRVHLAWVGGICDSQITVTVEPDLGSIAFDMGRQPDCDSIGIGRQLVLDFDGPLDVRAINVGEATALPSLSPTEGRGYELDCGPLGPDTCEIRAAEIIESIHERYPSKRVVSLYLAGGCGGYNAILDDGTGMGAAVDCFLTPRPS
jgi:hypothetical protein